MKPSSFILNSSDVRFIKDNRDRYLLKPMKREPHWNWLFYDLDEKFIDREENNKINFTTAELKYLYNLIQNQEGLSLNEENELRDLMYKGEKLKSVKCLLNKLNDNLLDIVELSIKVKRMITQKEDEIKQSKR